MFSFSKGVSLKKHEDWREGRVKKTIKYTYWYLDSYIAHTHNQTFNF